MDNLLNIKFNELKLEFDDSRKTLWISIQPQSVPSLTLNFLQEFRQVQEEIANVLNTSNTNKPKFIVLQSKLHRLFCLGIDMEYMFKLVKSKKNDLMKEYLDLYIETLFLNLVNLNYPIITIAFVNGRCYGAGMELSLSNDILLAGNNSVFGYPAIKQGFLINFSGFTIISERLHSFTKSILFNGNLINSNTMELLGLAKSLNTQNPQSEVNLHIDEISKIYQKHLIEHRTSKQKIVSVYKENFELHSEFILNCVMNMQYSQYSEISKIIRIQKKLYSTCELVPLDGSGGSGTNIGGKTGYVSQ